MTDNMFIVIKYDKEYENPSFVLPLEGKYLCWNCYGEYSRAFAIFSIIIDKSLKQFAVEIPFNAISNEFMNLIKSHKMGEIDTLTILVDDWHTLVDFSYTEIKANKELHNDN